MDKAFLREQVLEKRKSISKEEVHEKSLKIFENLFSLKEVSEAQNVALYISFNNEVETRQIIEKLWKIGKNVFVPVVENGSFSFAKLTSFENLRENQFGILGPCEKEIIDPKEIDLFVVPGLAFDSSGNRLGWGKGYYDIFFNKNKISAKKIGLAFELQIVEKISHKPHDVKMDFLLTNTEIYRF